MIHAYYIHFLYYTNRIIAKLEITILTNKYRFFFLSGRNMVSNYKVTPCNVLTISIWFTISKKGMTWTFGNFQFSSNQDYKIVLRERIVISKEDNQLQCSCSNVALICIVQLTTEKCLTVNTVYKIHSSHSDWNYCTYFVYNTFQSRAKILHY